MNTKDDTSIKLGELFAATNELLSSVIKLTAEVSFLLDAYERHVKQMEAEKQKQEWWWQQDQDDDYTQKH